jgi:hypothetical protein
VDLREIFIKSLIDLVFCHVTKSKKKAIYFLLQLFRPKQDIVTKVVAIQTRFI